MKQVSEMPTSGQFVAVYQKNGEINSVVYEINRMESSVIYVIDRNNPDYDCEYKARMPIEFARDFLVSQKAQFFIAD